MERDRKGRGPSGDGSSTARGGLDVGKRSMAQSLRGGEQGSTAIPFQAQMEAAFGEDFSSVQVETGQADAMDGIGARPGEKVASRMRIRQCGSSRTG